MLDEQQNLVVLPVEVPLACKVNDLFSLSLSYQWTQWTEVPVYNFVALDYITSTEYLETYYWET